MSRFLVTGASGILGSRIVDRLISSGHGVVSISRSIKTWDGTEWQDAEALIHCAFARSQDGSLLASSLDFAERVFRFAREHGVRRIVNVSSQSVYGGNRDRPSRESDVVSPMDIYAMAKYATERILETICRGGDVEAINLRLASVVGVEYSERVINKFVKRALAEHWLEVIGGSQRFAYLSVDDAVDGIADVAGMMGITSGIYNLGTEECVSLYEIALMVARAVESATGSNVVITVREDSGESFVRQLDTSKLSAAGWKAKKRLSTIVGDIVAYELLAIKRG